MPRAQLYRGWGTSLYARMSAPVVGPLHVRLIAQLTRELPPGTALLDIGSGPGAFLIGLAGERGDLSLTGLDPAAAAIRHAQRAAGARRITWLRATVEALPLAAESFDIAVATGSVKYWRDLQRAFADVQRVLRPRGRLLLHELDPSAGTRLDAVVTSYPRITAGILRRFVLPGSPALDVLRAAALAAGFTVADEGPVAGLPFNRLDLQRE